MFQGKATIKCTCGTQEALFELFVEPKAGTLVAQASANSTTVSFINRATGPVYYMTSNGVAGVIEASKTGDISLNADERVWFYGDNAAYGNGTPEGSSFISMDKDCLVSGNLMSLVDAANFETATLTEPDAFSYFFSGESHLKNDASNPIVLSAPNLTPGCYKGLFEGCSGLKAIEVGATDISASGATDGWLDGVSSTGMFVTPKPSQWCSGGNLPESWTVYEPSTEGPVLAQQAPAVGEGKAGTTITPVSGLDAHDGSIHIDSPADLAYSTDGGETWTDVPASGDITGLGLGKVLVHKKAAEPLDASPYVSISLKSVPAYTAPVAKSGLVYSSSAQNLVTAGSTSEGTTMEYKVGSGSWSSSLPTGTNAGNYTVYWRIKGNAQYVDVPESSLGTINIAKKAPSFSVNPTSVSFSSTDNVNATKTATITYDGDGTLSASSNNTGMATVSRNNKTLTITRKSADGGSVTITVSAAAGTNYSAATNQTITISLTSADLGTYLQNAVAGDKVGSNGKVYKPNATMPTGVTVVGCVVRPGVVFKASDEPGHLTSSQLYNYKVSAGKFHYHSMNDLWDRDWEIWSNSLYLQVLVNKDSEGETEATAAASLAQVNAYLQAAGCDPIDVNRYYGTSNGWFYWPSKLMYQTDPNWWHDNMGYTISARPLFTYDKKQ